MVANFSPRWPKITEPGAQIQLCRESEDRACFGVSRANSLMGSGLLMPPLYRKSRRSFKLASTYLIRIPISWALYGGAPGFFETPSGSPRQQNFSSLSDPRSNLLRALEFPEFQASWHLVPSDLPPLAASPPWRYSEGRPCGCQRTLAARGSSRFVRRTQCDIPWPSLVGLFTMLRYTLLLQFNRRTWTASDTSAVRMKVPTTELTSLLPLFLRYDCSLRSLYQGDGDEGDRQSDDGCTWT